MSRGKLHPGKKNGAALRCWRYALLFTGLTGTVLQAQVRVRTRVNDVAINGVIGAVTGAVWAAARDRPVWSGVTQGLIGGGLTSLGKQTAATPFAASGFIGREVSAVGISLITSAGDKSTTFVFPLGPLSLEYREHEYDWRLNVTDFISTVALSVSPNTRLDLRKSLSSGAPVFRDRRLDYGRKGNWDITAAVQTGTIQLSRSAFNLRTGKTNVLYHENVHILQVDFFESAIALPAERALIGRLPFGRRFVKHFDLGALGPAVEGQILRLIPYESNPLEREAYALTANLDY